MPRSIKDCQEPSEARKRPGRIRILPGSFLREYVQYLGFILQVRDLWEDRCVKLPSKKDVLLLT